MNSLPQKLYDLRKSRGLLQDDLAEELGVSRQAISKWEMGTGTPTLENLLSISYYFSVTIDSLVKDEYKKAENIGADVPARQNKHVITRKTKLTIQRLMIGIGISYIIGLVISLIKGHVSTYHVDLTVIFALCAFLALLSFICVKIKENAKNDIHSLAQRLTPEQIERRRILEEKSKKFFKVVGIILYIALCALIIAAAFDGSASVTLISGTEQEIMRAAEAETAALNDRNRNLSDIYAVVGTFFELSFLASIFFLILSKISGQGKDD